MSNEIKPALTPADVNALRQSRAHALRFLALLLMGAVDGPSTTADDVRSFVAEVDAALDRVAALLPPDNETAPDHSGAGA